MNTTATTLDAIYADEFAAAAELGATDIHVTNTGGGCTALEAMLGEHRMLATNGDACLLTADAIAEYLEDGAEIAWYIGLYDTNDDQGDIQIAEGSGDTFAEAFAAALDSRTRGDFVAE